MSAQQVVFQYLSAGSNTLTVPSGFSNQVLVYAWGAGGGSGFNGPAGGGGGFVQGIVTVSSGDTIVISVGGQGGVGPRDGSGIGGIGDTPAISFNGGTTGVGAPTDHNDDQNYGAGGGGGAATSVLVNGVPMIVAAGGGGGGGGRSYQTGSPGTAGGVATLTSTTPRGGTSPGGYSVGGGGGAGYPFGGAGGETFGDDAGAATGGYGGQNYANASVTSSTLTAGSGATPGGVTNALYPRAKRGYAGYDGAVIVIFTKSFQVYVKDTDWKLITNAYVKVPSSSKTLYTTLPPTTTTFTNPGSYTFTVPAGVTSLNAAIAGGSGGGGGGGTGAGQTGGTSYQDIRTITVTPGETLTITVGAGGQGGRSGIPNCGSDGITWINVNADTNQTRGLGGTGYASGAAGSGASCPNSFNSTGGWSGGGGGSSALTYSGGTVIAGGGSGGNGGTNYGGGAGVGGTGENSGTGNQGTAGVTGGAGQAATFSGGYGTNGRSGVVTLSYSSSPVATIATTGGWTPITQAWIKEDNEWKSIQSGISLVPIPSTADVVTINLNIAANANNYVLSDFLSATSYYPGRSIVNLTVNAGVIVGSGSAGTPALIIDGLVSGDLINLINNGNIAGAGGQGGEAGSYVVTSTPVLDSKGNPVQSKGSVSIRSTVTSIPGRPGEVGGSALYVTYATNLINNGTIAGGGGGGGGGGGPTGGQGGGGAGRKAGSGANNGTLTAGGAGAGLGGAGGARGSAGSAGTNNTNAGGLGGAPGPAILGIDKVSITTAGTIIGEQKVIAREVG